MQNTPNAYRADAFSNGFIATELNARVAALLNRAYGSLDRDRAVARDYIERAAALLSDQLPSTPVAAQSLPSVARGGLAPWQANRVSAYILEKLDSPISIEELANLCRLSTSHFSRAFKASFGEPPHAYIIRQRVEEAKRVMLESVEPLSQIAAACGFADQSHFCRHFRRAVGVSPNTWRRERATAPCLLAAE